MDESVKNSINTRWQNLSEFRLIWSTAILTASMILFYTSWKRHILSGHLHIKWFGRYKLYSCQEYFVGHTHRAYNKGLSAHWARNVNVCRDQDSRTRRPNVRPPGGAAESQTTSEVSQRIATTLLLYIAHRLKSFVLRYMHLCAWCLCILTSWATNIRFVCSGVLCSDKFIRDIQNSANLSCEFRRFGGLRKANTNELRISTISWAPKSTLCISKKQNELRKQGALPTYLKGRVTGSKTVSGRPCSYVFSSYNHHKNPITIWILLSCARSGPANLS